MNKKSSSATNISLKILACGGFASYSYAIFSIAMFFIDFDNSWNRILMYICFYTITILVILQILTTKNRDIFGKITILAIVITILNSIYYLSFGTNLESLLYLNKKYNFKFSQMKVVDTRRYRRAFLSPSIPRGVTIKHKDDTIFVYFSYDGKWKDDYKERKEYYKNIQKIEETINTAMKTYKVEYSIARIQDDYIQEEDQLYDTKVFIYNTNADTAENIIKYLKQNNIDCGLYFINDKEIYNSIINKYKENYDNFIATPLKELHYDLRYITVLNHFSKEVYINKGDPTDPRYINPNNYQYIIIFYENSQMNVCGINPAKE